MPSDLSNYDITFNRNRLIGTWSWVVSKNPGPDVFTSFGVFFGKEAAERDALKAIEAHETAETISGYQLHNRVTARTEREPKQA